MSNEKLLVDCIQASSLLGKEQFEFVEELSVRCKSCETEQDVRGFFTWIMTQMSVVP